MSPCSDQTVFTLSKIKFANFAIYPIIFFIFIIEPERSRSQFALSRCVFISTNLMLQCLLNYLT